jgi:pyruvate/2-oxoglutarate/acetoin dehydrogenase E1 component
VGDVLKYLDEVNRAMLHLGQDPKVIFLGQSVAYKGNVIFKSLESLPPDRKLELPVVEEMQMGMSIGLALGGYIPVSVFPRFNFLLLALNQLVNHLDKIPHISKGAWRPRVIIKTMVGSVRPLHPGIQHCGDFTEALRKMLDWVVVEDLQEPEQVFPAYAKALERDGATVLVEHGDHYHER